MNSRKKVCTCECCIGDYVYFTKAVFSGEWRNAKYEGTERLEGKVLKESYGAAGQHVFLLELSTGKTLRIKGRTLYKNGLQRDVWDNEKKRQAIVNEKPKRREYKRKKYF